MTILQQITERIAEDLHLAQRQMPLPQLRAVALAAPLPPADFAAALAGGRNSAPPRIIAELKKASPSRGIIRADFPVAQLATELAANGAAALSVLTERHYFHGAPEFLQQVVATVKVPVLRKDFIIDAYQLYEARLWGASAVLLIAACLSASELGELAATAHRLGLATLVEVHDHAELQMVLDSCDAGIIGVNSRNLKTFHTDLAISEQLLAAIPASYIRVAESGIGNAADIARLRAAGADAFLIGETVMRNPEPGQALAQLLQPL